MFTEQKVPGIRSKKQHLEQERKEYREKKYKEKELSLNHLPIKIVLLFSDDVFRGP